VIEQGRDQRGDRALRADAVIVGSGAAGGMAALELSRRGLQVVLLEEGPLLRTRDMTQREDEMMPRLYHQAGGQMTRDRAIRVLSGRSLGGSTVHNMNLCKRLPAALLEMWAREQPVTGLSVLDLDPVFASVEADLGVIEIPAEHRNANNRVLERGVSSLGWRGGPLWHNRLGCQRTGFCDLGCPYDGKQNSAKVLIPEAHRRGAHVITDARADLIKHDGREARGVEAAVLGEDGTPHGRLYVEAGAVVLAASAIGSAVLVGRSRLPDPHWRAGRGLSLHPGVAVAGLFDERIDGYQGIPQSYECTELLDHTPGSDRRIWITTAFAHPIGAAAMLPGFGEEHRRWMKQYAHLAVLTAMLHDDPVGQVGVRKDGLPRVSYRLDRRACEHLGRGIRACAELLLAAGARRVLVPHVPPLELASPSDLGRLSSDLVRPHALPITSVHPLGTLPLGDDPRRAVVRSDGEHHQIRRLFVLDGSLFPTGLGVPPQLGIYAMARHLSPFVADRAAH